MVPIAEPSPPARVSTYSRVEDWLFAYTREHDVEVGQRLPTERDMAARCGVSRATVRQALAALQAQGIVRVRHGDGCYLARRPEDQRALTSLLTRQRPLREVLEARAALEVNLARLAARRRTAEDVRAMSGALALMERELAEGGAGLDGDRRFHEAVTAAAHNPLMAELLDHFSGDLLRVRSVSLTSPGRPRRSLTQHQAIADAVERGDGPAAEAATREHLEAIAELIGPDVAESPR